MSAGQAGRAGQAGQAGLAGPTGLAGQAWRAGRTICGAALKGCATVVRRAATGRAVRRGCGIATVLAAVAQAFRPAVAQPNPNAPANFVSVQAPVIALTHARVIDGTGAAPRDDQTMVIRDGRIADVGGPASLAVPAGATTVDLSGKTVIPGLVMMHEHLYYTTGPGVYGQLGASFTRLYLAGGVTTMRTAGNVNGTMDIILARRTAAGAPPGPAVDAAAPYVNGPSAFLQVHSVTNADQARPHVAYWADQGATSLKAYMQISRAALEAAIDEGHRRGMKITGHLSAPSKGWSIRFSGIAA